MEHAIATIKKMHFTGREWVFIDFVKESAPTTDVIPAPPAPAAPVPTDVVIEDIPE